MKEPKEVWDPKHVVYTHLELPESRFHHFVPWKANICIAGMKEQHCMLWVGAILGNILQKNDGICPPDWIAAVSLGVLGSKEILQGYSEISLST